MRRVLFTGSRDWTDEGPVAAIVDGLPPDAVVIHGGARGLDSIVNRLAKARGLQVLPFPAEWKKHGRQRAGQIRNQKMIDKGKPTEAHAFPLPASVGTWDMLQRLCKAGIPYVIHDPAPRYTP